MGAARAVRGRTSRGIQTSSLRESENMHFYAQEYSKALGRTITFEDIPV
jgi:hypothetical protein